MDKALRSVVAARQNRTSHGFLLGVTGGEEYVHAPVGAETAGRDFESPQADARHARRQVTPVVAGDELQGEAIFRLNVLGEGDAVSAVEADGFAEQEVKKAIVGERGAQVCTEDVNSASS